LAFPRDFLFFDVPRGENPHRDCFANRKYLPSAVHRRYRGERQEPSPGESPASQFPGDRLSGKPCPKATEVCGCDENVDRIVAYISVLRKEMMEGIFKAQEKVRKPIAIITFLEYAAAESPLSRLFGAITREELLDLLRRMYRSGISVHATEQEAARMLSALLQYKRHLDSRTGI